MAFLPEADSRDEPPDHSREHQVSLSRLPFGGMSCTRTDNSRADGQERIRSVSGWMSVCQAPAPADSSLEYADRILHPGASDKLEIRE